jgi:hypothetical protein
VRKALVFNVRMAEDAAPQENEVPTYPPLNDEHFVRAFVCQIHSLCMGFERVARRIGTEEWFASTAEACWDDIELLLARATRIANYIDTTSNDGKAKRRSRLLRERLGISQGGFAELRDVRNGFEHIDERMDEWWRTDPLHNLVDLCIMQKSGIVGSGLVFARHYDPEAAVVSSFKVDTDLRKVAQTVASVADACVAWLNQYDQDRRR